MFSMLSKFSKLLPGSCYSLKNKIPYRQKILVLCEVNCTYFSIISTEFMNIKNYLLPLYLNNNLDDINLGHTFFP